MLILSPPNKESWFIPTWNHRMHMSITRLASDSTSTEVWLILNHQVHTFRFDVNDDLP